MRRLSYIQNLKDMITLIDTIHVIINNYYVHNSN